MVKIHLSKILGEKRWTQADLSRKTGIRPNTISELYNELADEALRVSMTITKDKMKAADAVQETFIRVYNNIHSFDVSKSFKPWFYRILINESKRIVVKHSKIIPFDNFKLDVVLGYKEEEHKFQEYEILYKSISSLKINNRIPIVLKYLKGFSEKEIAEILNLNQNTVKSRLFKGRQQLKNIIIKTEGGFENNG